MMLIRVLLHLLDPAIVVGDLPERDLGVEVLRFVDETGPACFD